MLKDLYRMAVYAKVVEAGSFSAAALALGLGKSVVSEHVTALERRFGVRLIHRSTRSLTTTEEGRRFYARCRQMLDAAEGARLDLDDQRQRPTGTIRLTASYNLGLGFLIERLARFRARHPELAIDLVLEDAVVNLIEEGFDLALRVGQLPGNRLHAAPLGRCEMRLYAAPAYLERHPRPREPADLATAPWVSITQLPHPDRLALQHRSGRRQTVRVRPTVRTNTGIAARSFIAAGVGIGLLPDYGARSLEATGELVRLLPEWREQDRPISAIFPTRDHMPLKTRILLDFLRAEFEQVGAAPDTPGRARVAVGPAAAAPASTAAG
jgi:DNA-binding transcriptional LysR family regulator